MKFRDRLISIEACQESIEWVGNRSAQKAWQECPSPYWKIWLRRACANPKDRRDLFDIFRECKTTGWMTRKLNARFPKCPRLKWST